MKYNILINQAKAIEWELNLSEAAVFAFVYELPSWAESMHIDGQPWYFASRNKAIEEVPIITSKPDTMYRLYKSLQDKGLIKWQKVGEREYIQVTDKGKSWNKVNPSLGKKSEQARKIIRDTSEKNPTYNTIIDNSTIDKGETPPPVGNETLPPSPLTTANNIDAHLNAKNNLLTMAAARKIDLPESKFAEAYFLNQQQRGHWYALTVPTDPGEVQLWLAKHIAGLKAWAKREPSFRQGRGGAKGGENDSVTVKLPKI
jgi:hypothetical protein